MCAVDWKESTAVWASVAFVIERKMYNNKHLFALPPSSVTIVDVPMVPKVAGLRKVIIHLCVNGIVVSRVVGAGVLPSCQWC